jgi:hypothetical protein
MTANNRRFFYFAFSVLCVVGVSQAFGDGLLQRIRQNRQERGQSRQMWSQPSAKVSFEQLPTASEVAVCTGPDCETIVVTPVLNPAPPAATPVASPIPAPFVAQSVIETKQSFRRAFVKAVSAARKKGEVSARQAIQLRVASFSPAFLDRVEQLCVVQMAFSGEADDYLPTSDDGTIDTDGIDWEGLASFLEKIIPLVLTLLEAFGL